MNYAAFIGAPITDPLGADAAAQSYMMYDIAALQYYYGANFGNVGKNFTYSWDRSTGQEFINGQGQGEPLIDKVFETVWTGGANRPTTSAITTTMPGWTCGLASL